MDIIIIGMLNESLNVSTSYDYLKKMNGFFDDEKEPSDIEHKEMEAIQNILSMDVAIYITRRTSGLCGSVIDNLRNLRVFFINQYNAEYKKHYVDYNCDVDF